MAFETGDKVTVVDCEELSILNLATEFVGLLTDTEVDEVKPDMKGTIVNIYDKEKDTYVVDFGNNFKGVAKDGKGNGTCQLVVKEALKLIEQYKKEFKPHLEFVDGNYAGELGKITKLKASDGTPLRIGDVVEIDETMLSVVVEEDGNEYFMGCKGMIFEQCFKPDVVFKKFSFLQVWDGDIIASVKYVKERGGVND